MTRRNMQGFQVGCATYYLLELVRSVVAPTIKLMFHVKLVQCGRMKKQTYPSFTCRVLTRMLPLQFERRHYEFLGT